MREGGVLQLDHLVLARDRFRLTADWSVATGERVALIGPSGAGKSTLLAAIAGFLPPVAGRVLWQGADLAGVPAGKRPLSILFQDQNLFPHLTLAQNLGLGLRPDLRLTAPEAAAVESALADAGLAGMGARRPGALSGGQAARASLARALLRARPLLLLDEPFAALGPGLRDEMLALVSDVADRSGAAIMMVTHDPGEARMLCSMAVMVADGVAEAPVPVGRLLDNPPPALRAYLGKQGL